MLFSEWLRGRMAARNLTQLQLGRAVGLSQQQVSRYLAGESLPAARTVFRLAKTLDVPVDEIFEALEASLIPGSPRLDEELSPDDDRAELRRRLDVIEEVRRLRRELGGREEN